MMTDYFKNARVTNTWPAHTPRARKLARRHPGLVKVRRYQDDSGKIKKTIELDLEAIMHKHQAISEKTVPFNHCVDPENCNPMSHGNITDIETCSCGATRRININGSHVEKGPWEVKE